MLERIHEIEIETETEIMIVKNAMEGINPVPIVEIGIIEIMIESETQIEETDAVDREIRDDKHVLSHIIYL